LRVGVSRAMDALGSSRPDAAIAELTRLLDVDGRSYEVHLFLGDAYASKREFEHALGEYAAAGVLNPRAAAPALSSARVHLARGDTARAQQRLDAAAAIEPAGSSDVALVRGMILEATGQLPAALDAYGAAVRRQALNTESRARLASLAMRLKRFDEAQPQFEALLRMGYRPSRMHFGLAQIAEAKGDLKRAAAEYREAVRLEPSFADARTALARVER
jgi:tetratricopeptide (TPR) repeat protein